MKNTQQPTVAGKPRDHTMDLIKGIAIYLVVMGHVLTMCVREIDAAFIFKIIGQVHMPLFFFVSGYFSYKHGGDREFAAPRLGKRFCQLMIPFFVVSALWVTYFPHSGLQSPLSDNLPGLYRSCMKDGYWFPLCLFELSLLYYVLSRLLSAVKPWWARVVVLLVVYALLQVLAVLFSSEEANVDYLGLGVLARFFPIFIIGVLAGSRKAAFNRLRRKEWCLALSMVTFAVLLYVIVYPWDMPWWENAAAVRGVNAVLLPVMQVALVVVAMRAVETWSEKEYAPGTGPGIVARYFNLLGVESLGVYLLHYFFLFPLTALQEPLRQMSLGFTPLAVVAAVVAFAVIAVTLLVVYLIGRSKWLALLLIGKC